MKAKRRSWVANYADPTQVTEWKITLWFIRITLLCSWGVSATTAIGHRVLRSYDARWAKRLYGYLEDRWETEQMKYEDDPMGHLSYYE